MKRTIEDQPAVAEVIAADNLTNLRDWLQGQAAAHNFRWLLAHADDGVIWGRVEANGLLITSHDAAQGHTGSQDFCPPLRTETLQQVRLFAEEAELLLWRDGDNIWHARLIRQPVAGETPTFAEAIDEPHILWGTDPQPQDNGFTLMSDGAQGLRHTVPLEVTGQFNEPTRPLRLWVRHYLAEDDSGFNQIVASRLVDLRLEEAQ
jgi:CRISPR-associated protein (TIGR03984 family)